MFKRTEDVLEEIMKEHKCDRENALRILCAGNAEFRKMIEKLTTKKEEK